MRTKLKKRPRRRLLWWLREHGHLHVRWDPTTAFLFVSIYRPEGPFFRVYMVRTHGLFLRRSGEGIFLHLGAMEF